MTKAPTPQPTSTSFYLLLLGGALLFWFLQGYVMDLDLLGVLGPSYLINTVLAGAIYTVIFRLKEKHSEKLGFIFLAGSGVKFAAFFVFLQPVFMADGQMSNIEFAVFFIPYGLTTALETTFLVRALNRS